MAVSGRGAAPANPATVTSGATVVGCGGLGIPPALFHRGWRRSGPGALGNSGEAMIVARCAPRGGCQATRRRWRTTFAAMLRSWRGGDRESRARGAQERATGSAPRTVCRSLGDSSALAAGVLPARPPSPGPSRLPRSISKNHMVVIPPGGAARRFPESARRKVPPDVAGGVAAGLNLRTSPAVRPVGGRSTSGV